MIIQRKEKRRRHLLRVAGARDGKVYIGPESLYLPVTNRCNLRCRYCWFHSPGNPLHSRPHQDMLWKEFQQVVTDCVQIKVDTLFLSAEGEPTLHPQFSQMMAYLESQPLGVTIFTNGTFSPQQLADVTKADKIGVNLGAPERQGYNFLQGKDLFDRVIGNIRQLVRFRDMEKPLLHIGVDFVVNAANMHQTKKVEAMLRKLRVDSFSPTIMKEHDWNKDVSLKAEPNLFLEDGKISMRCFHGWFSMIRDLNGRVRLCPQLPHETACHSHGSLVPTWQSPEYMQARLEGRSGKLYRKFKECRNCLFHMTNNKVLSQIVKRG